MNHCGQIQMTKKVSKPVCRKFQQKGALFKKKHDSAHLQEWIADTRHIMFWGVASHYQILQYANQLWYHLHREVNTCSHKVMKKRYGLQLK